MNVSVGIWDSLIDKAQVPVLPLIGYVIFVYTGNKPTQASVQLNNNGHVMSVRDEVYTWGRHLANYLTHKSQKRQYLLRSRLSKAC